MNKKYEGSLHQFPSNHIYLNVNHLEEGSYILEIIHKDKVIKSIRFIKD